jgi:Elongation factor Tu C-terminal domain
MTFQMTSTITTIDQLSSLVDIDNKDHKIKDIAELFLNAMTDWTTFNQTNIFEFVQELKQYFGAPLTKEKISQKSLNVSEENSVWRHESGSSIFQMIDTSERFCNESNFDRIFQNVISYYEQLLKIADFVADLKYLTEEEGGRKTPAFSGYRPQVKFSFFRNSTSGQQTFLDKEIVNPGDTVKAAIKIISVDYFENTLSEGMDFDFREGSKIVGTGKIISIPNVRLRKPAGNIRFGIIGA